MSNKPAKVPFFKAAHELAKLADKIEEMGENEDIDAALIELFGEGEQALADSIDRRKGLADELRIRMDMAENRISEIRVFVKKMDKILDGLKRRTLETIEACPEIPFRDGLGRKIYSQRARPSLELSFKPQRKSFEVLDLEEIGKLGIEIEKKYMTLVSFLVLDTDKVRADLTANEVLPWANLKTTTFLKGL